MSTHGNYNESSALLGEEFGASASSGKYLHDELMDVPLHGSLADDKSNSAAPADSRTGTRDERASSSSSTGQLKPTLSVMPQTPLQTLNIRPELQVSVLAPEKATGTNSLGLTTTFTTYLLQTKTTLPSFPEQMASVRRRFSDFDALYHMLRALYAGYFVPKLPEKDFVNGKMVVTDDFVERRAEELQVFITRACNHEVLHTSKALELFLTLDTDNLTQRGEWKRLESADSLFLSFRHLFSPVNSHENGQESLEGARRSALAKLGDSVMLTFKKISDQVKAQIAPDMTQLVPEESRLRDTGAHLQEAAYGYATLLLRWSRAMKALAALSVVLAEMGAEFSKLYNFEDRSFPKFGQFTPLGRSLCLAAADYQKVAYHALSVGSACQRHVAVLEKAASPLRHVDSSLREGVTAYKDREQLYVASSELRTRLQEKRERYRVVSPEAGSPVSESQTAGLQHMLKDIKAMEEKLQELDKDYATVADINRQETQAALESKDKLVPLAILQMAQTQQHLEEYSADRWQQLAKALEEAAGS